MEGVPVVVVLWEAPPTEQQVDLLAFAHVGGQRHDRVARRRAHRGLAPVGHLEMRFEGSAEFVVVEQAGGGDHDVGRAVVLGQESDDVVAVHGAHGVGVAEYFAAQRMIGEHALHEQHVDPVVGRVERRPQLLEDDLALGVDVGGTQCRRRQDPAEQLDPEAPVIGGQAGVERGVLTRGEGVHVATDGVDGLGDGTGRAGLGALEEQVLEEVADARDGRRLVASADADPHAGGHRAGMGHGVGDHLDAVGEGRDAGFRGGHGACVWRVGQEDQEARAETRRPPPPG